MELTKEDYKIIKSALKYVANEMVSKTFKDIYLNVLNKVREIEEEEEL